MKPRSEIVLIAGNQADLISAANLGRAFYQCNDVTVIPIQGNINCFKSLAIADLQEILILGHGSENSFAEQPPKDFVNMLNQHFLNAFLDDAKMMVNEIYIVGCNVGLIDAMGNSLAQTMLDQLHELGFINARIHAYCYMTTVNDKQCDLMVDVINNTGPTHAERKDEVTANETDHDPRSDSFGNISPSGYIKAAIQYPDKRKARILLEGADPKSELSHKQQNIFLPLEKIEARLNRIAKELVEQKLFTRQNVIFLLKQQRNHLRTKNKMDDKVKALLLKTYITRLALRSDDNWKEELNNIVEDANRKKMIFNKGSTTLDLLRQIQLEDVDAINRIHANQSALPPEAINERTSQFTTDINDDSYEQIQSDILIAIEKLRMQIKELKVSIFSNLDFVQKQITAKQEKLEVLQSLRDAEDFMTAYRIARDHSTPEIISLGRASRTTAILSRIIHYGGEEANLSEFRRVLSEAYL